MISLPGLSTRHVVVLLLLLSAAMSGSAASRDQGLPEAGAIVGTLPIAAPHAVLFAARVGSLFAVDF
jgi:hypothetical protein